jgi:predicted RNase H-like HicB family nuclease
LFYHGIVHKDEDSAYGVYFPDLPGCFSAADDLDDIIQEASDALALYFDGKDDVIVPSSLQSIQNRAQDDLANGAFVILVPFIPNTNTPTRVNISLDAGILAAIDATASQQKLTRSAFIAKATRNEIERRRV